MAESIWMCTLYGKVVESFLTLAPAGVTVFPGNKTELHPEVIAESLFGDLYAAFVHRAAGCGRFYFQLEPYKTVSPPSFTDTAQQFLNAAYNLAVERDNHPAASPEFYGLEAPAPKRGWPVYFLAVGIGLDLPAEAYRGKVELPGI